MHGVRSTAKRLDSIAGGKRMPPPVAMRGVRSTAKRLDSIAGGKRSTAPGCHPWCSFNREAVVPAAVRHARRVLPLGRTSLTGYRRPCRTASRFPALHDRDPGCASRPWAKESNRFAVVSPTRNARHTRRRTSSRAAGTRPGTFPGGGASSDSRCIPSVRRRATGLSRRPRSRPASENRQDIEFFSLIHFDELRFSSWRRSATARVRDNLQRI